MDWARFRRRFSVAHFQARHVQFRAMSSESPDQLDQEIAAKRAEIAQIEQALGAERNVLRGMLRAAELRPAVKMNGAPSHAARPETPAVLPSAEPPTSPRSGKPPGTLGSRWRSILGRHARTFGIGFAGPELWAANAATEGHPMSVKAVRDWLRRAAVDEHKYIERNGDTYRVSQTAVERFNLMTAEPSPEVSSDGSA